MLNLLSYIGVNLQSELCLWTLLGLLRTIFDATLFKVNSNLKQVWQMSMPPELSMPVQRGLRTMISGVMLVQCFTVYVYLATYIVLLYPVFLEERPNLLLPWLLLAAIRKFLCELMSLALGLGTCVLLGPARPPCIKFVVFKIASITPAFYMWMLVLSYYNTLKVAAAFKRFPAVMQSSDHDYGLELAVRRRRTKSLQDEEQLRRKLVASFNYGERTSQQLTTPPRLKPEVMSRMVHSTHVEFEDIKAEMEEALEQPITITGPTDRMMSDLGTYEDWCGSEMIVPRDADRILEQFCIMMLRIGSFLKAEGTNAIKIFTSKTNVEQLVNKLDCSAMQNEDSDTPPLVGTSRQNTAAYLHDYPQIFMKKPHDSFHLKTDSQLVKSKDSSLLSQMLSNGNKDKNLTSLSPKILLQNVDINSITLNRKSSPGKNHSNETLNNQDEKTLESEIKQKYEVHNSMEAFNTNSESLARTQFLDQNLDLEIMKPFSNSSVSRNVTREVSEILQNNKETIFPLEEQTIFTVDLDSKPEMQTTMTERDTKQTSDEFKLFANPSASFQIENLPKDENQRKQEDTTNETDNPSSTQTKKHSSSSVTESKKEK